MGSFAMPQTENNSLLNELLQRVLLISSAPVQFIGAIYYLPLICEEDLLAMNAFVVNWQIVESMTKSFLTEVSQAKLKNISGLSGKLLQPYHTNDTILLLTTQYGSQYLVYGTLENGYLKMQ